MEKGRDEVAAERFRNGDPGGLEELYDRHADVVFRYLCFLTPDQDLREEVFQETWVRLAAVISRRGGPNHFRAYAVATARNLFRNHMRKRAKDSVFLVPPKESDGGEEWSREPPDTGPGPREKLENATLAERLRNEVRRLPPKEREVFLLRVEAGLKFREIARVLRRPVGTVLARMHRATKRLRKNLGDIE